SSLDRCAGFTVMLSMPPAYSTVTTYARPSVHSDRSGPLAVAARSDSLIAPASTRTLHTALRPAPRRRALARNETPPRKTANHLCSLVHVQPRHTARCVPTAQMSEHRRPVDAVLLRELLNGRASEIVPDKPV